MLLLDEINRCAHFDLKQNVFDLLKIVDNLTKSTRG